MSLVGNYYLVQEEGASDSVGVVMFTHNLYSFKLALIDALCAYYDITPSVVNVPNDSVLREVLTKRGGMLDVVIDGVEYTLWVECVDTYKRG